MTMFDGRTVIVIGGSSGMGPATEADFGDAAVGILGSRYLTGQVVVLDGGQALLDG